MITLPGLRGDDPLGFFAALGLLSLSELELLPDLTLAWAQDQGLAASIGGVTSRKDLSGALDSAFHRLRGEETPLPCGLADFPPRKHGSAGSDPIRLPPDRMAEHFTAAERHSSGKSWAARWIIALSSQMSLRPKGDVDLTPFYAPTGQMTMRRSIFDAVAEAVEEIGSPTDALTAWRRTSFDGANFDYRAIRDGAVTTNGKPSNQGAPSPTWLATMAIPFFPLVDTSHGASAVGWQRAWLYAGYTSRSFVWPLWKQPLDSAAARIMVSHEALRLKEQVRNERTPPRLLSDIPMRGLGVFAVYGASRRTLSQGDGPLGPGLKLWPA
ncbi:MAG: type I-G CRISPR-associated protein, Cas3-extension family [Acidimicrobiia bacterium]